MYLNTISKTNFQRKLLEKLNRVAGRHIEMSQVCSNNNK